MLLLVGVGIYVYRSYFVTSSYETKDERYNAESNRRQRELDQLLDKISNQGVNGLSDHERRRLDELSGKK